MLQRLEQFDVSRCHGCGLCALVCPVFQQGGSVLTTPHGMAKALQAGGELSADDVNACILCGACAPLCPQDIDLMQLLVQLRVGVNGLGMTDAATSQVKQPSSQVVLIADPHLAADRQRLEKVLNVLEGSVTLAADQGEDIAHAMRQGQPVAKQRMNAFMASLQSVRQIIISDGLLQYLICSTLPKVRMSSLGEVLSRRGDVTRQLSAGDLYVADSQSYHANLKVSINHYDALHRKTGVQLNRDLHRLAIPTGAGAINNTGVCRTEAQIAWLTQGRQFNRVITESIADSHVIKKHTNHDVVHILELVA